MFKRLLDQSIPNNTIASLSAEQCLVVQMHHPKDELSLALQLIHAGFESWCVSLYSIHGSSRLDF